MKNHPLKVEAVIRPELVKSLFNDLKKYGLDIKMQKDLNQYSISFLRLIIHLNSFENEGRKVLVLNPKKDINPIDDNFLLQAEKIVVQNLENPDFSIKYFARFLAISQPILYQKMGEYLGLTPGQFIKEIKLKSAKNLLLSTDLLIKNIAYDSGFSDPDYFTKAFKKETGLTPSEFRNAGVKKSSKK